MKNFRKLTILLAALGLIACSPKYYTANTENVPLISEKGETNLTLAGSPDQFEFQASYGITNNIAVIANGGLFKPSAQGSGNGGSGKIIEFGAGYFKPLTENWIFETYGIVGFGAFENHLSSTITEYPQTNGEISANILRIGIQPNFGYKSKHFSAAVSSRFVNLSYNNIKGDLIFEDINQQSYLNENSSNFLIEPALTIRAGFEKFKIQVQHGYSANMTNSNFRQNTIFSTIGINYNFN